MEFGAALGNPMKQSFRASQNILFTFTSFHDPYKGTPVAGEDQAGPILTVLSALQIERILLFATPRTVEMTSATAEAIHERSPAITVDKIYLSLEDPTDYAAILTHLRRECGSYCERFPEANLFVLTAAGTPQMHACWLLLAASGEVPARLVHTREAKFASAQKPAVYIIDLAKTTFPRILPAFASHSEAGELSDTPKADMDMILDEVGLVGEHPKFKKALRRAAACAGFSVPVLLMGETGTGKELFAKFIHRLSDRSLRPFVVVNCAAIPETLVESILFGHRKGAFTGANEDLKGKFSAAHTGTLFLDEVGELPLETQAKLLRALETGEIEPLGQDLPVQVDARVIAATNRNLLEEIKAKRFREDLYYRLKDVVITLPPLRERRSDIPRLAIYLLQSINKHMRRQRQLSPEALVALQSRSWPGNVRDLRAVLRGSVILSAGKEALRPEDLQFEDPEEPEILGLPEPHEGFDLVQWLSNARKHMIECALEKSGNNASQAAKLLGTSPQAVSNFLKIEKITKPLQSMV